MRFGGRHSTVYRYNVPVSLEPHVFRLKPRVDGAQRLLHHELQIDPAPAGRTECLDQDGNVVVHAWFRGTTEELRVLNSFEVETLRKNPFDFLLTHGCEFALPFSYPESVRPSLAPYAHAQGIPEAVKEFAESAARDAGFRSLAFLQDVNRRLFDTCRQVVRNDGPPLASELTLQAREGSCRDLAVLLCDICRAVGIAARFVSGYESAAVEEAHSYMHAWAEVYLPGAGWRGYDPSRGLAVSTSHVAVAAGRTSDLAAPISGTFRGSAAASMETHLELRTGAECRE